VIGDVHVHHGHLGGKDDCEALVEQMSALHEQMAALHPQKVEYGLLGYDLRKYLSVNYQWSIRFRIPPATSRFYTSINI
jgi:hypothetical protein